MLPVTVEIYHFPNLNQIHTNSNPHKDTLRLKLFVELFSSAVIHKYWQKDSNMWT